MKGLSENEWSRVCSVAPDLRLEADRCLDAVRDSVVMLGFTEPEDEPNSPHNACCTITSHIRLGVDPPLSLWETLLFARSLDVSSPTSVVDTNGTLDDDDDTDAPSNDYKGRHHSAEKPTGFFATGTFENSCSSSSDDDE